MQDMREIELEIVDQTQNSRYVLRFEPLLYVPAFTEKDFYYATQDLPHREPPLRDLQVQGKEYTTPFSNTATST